MKYEFVKKDADTTTLKYKDKEFDFKRDIELQTLLQGVYMKARRKMLMDLTKEGLTKENLIIKTIKNGKTYEDTTNLNEMEQSYVEDESLNLMDNIIHKYTGMSFVELIVDMELDYTDKETITEFSSQVALAIKGKSETPSKA